MSFQTKLLLSVIILTILIRPDRMSIYGSDKTYFRYQLKDSVDAETNEQYFTKVDENEVSNSLYKRGTIYRGIKINADQGTSMISGLNLELKGNISDSLEVSAFIFDDKLAISEEGSTEALANIDNIYIQFKHPNFLTRMGDYNIDYSSGEFGDIKKDLSGIFISANKNTNSIDAFVSTESSQFATFKTVGINGISGPYLINSANGSRDQIIPNSETVYLNGNRLNRGEDYFLDNLNSELYFKANMPITGEDIIVVDYQYMKSDYKKIFYGFNSENKFINDKFTFNINYFNESDDKNNPLSFDLNEEIEAVMQSNSNTDYIYTTGAEFEENKGEYDLLPDSVHFVYSGAQNGDYRVKFSYFETGGEYNLSYDSLGAVYFVYDPVNGGDYLPLIRRNTPKGSSRLQSIANYTSSNVTVETEFAASNSNDNLFYSENTKFDGFGDRERVILQSDEKQFGKLKLDLNRKNYNDNLILPARINKVLTADEIDPYGWASSNSSTIYNAKVTHSYKLITNNSYETFYSRIGDNLTENGNRFNSQGNFGKYLYNGTIFLNEVFDDTLKIEKLSYNFSNSFSTDYWKVSPYFNNIITKNISEIQTTGSDEKKIGNMFNYWYNDKIDLNLRSELGKYDKIIQNDKSEYLIRYTNILEMKNRISSILNSEMILSDIVNEYNSGDSTDSRYDLLNFKVNYNKNNDYRIFVEYETERTRFIPKIRTYYSVEEGTGNYIYIDGEYYPDEFGNFDYYTSFGDNITDITGVKFDLRSFFDFPDQSDIKNILYWLSRIDLEQDISIKEKTKNQNIEDIMLLNLSQFQNDSTVNGLIETKTTLYFFKNRKISMEYYFNYRKNVFREYQNYSENTLFNEQFMSLKNSSGNFTHKITGRYSNLERYGFSGLIKSDDIKKKYITYNLRHNFNRHTNYSTEFEFGQENEAVKNIESVSYRVSPNLSFSFNGKGIFKAGMDFIRIVSDIKLPFSMNNGLGQGWSYKWNLSSDYEFSKNITGNLTYFGRLLSYDIRAFHELKAEIRMNL